MNQPWVYMCSPSRSPLPPPSPPDPSRSSQRMCVLNAQALTRLQKKIIHKKEAVNGFGLNGITENQQLAVCIS